MVIDSLMVIDHSQNIFPTAGGVAIAPNRGDFG